MYYLYDLAGHVVTEINSSGGWNRGEVYAGGKHLATYVDNTTYFDQGDWLGTERARTDASGAVAETCTGLPFGDDMNCTAGGISPLYFTGKQRDTVPMPSRIRDGPYCQDRTETGLDYFGARYSASNLGRFMTPDWSAKVEPVPYAKLGSPQSLNLYAYVLDNPTTLTDADGHCRSRMSCMFINLFRPSASSGQAHEFGGAQFGGGGASGFWTPAPRPSSTNTASGSASQTVSGTSAGSAGAAAAGAACGAACSATQSQAASTSTGSAPSIRTQYGVEIQSSSPEAQSALGEAQNGATLYRVGQLGRSATGEGQYWSLQNPLVDPRGYAQSMGLDPGLNPDFAMAGTLDPGSMAISNAAAPLGENGGLGIQIVTEENAVDLLWFVTF